MPAESQAQQKLMGMALAYKRGKMPGASKKIKEVAEGMSEKQLKDFAKTKHEDLPEKKAFVLGFVKRASEYGLNENQAVELLKSAKSKEMHDYDLLRKLEDRKMNVPIQTALGALNLPYNAYRDITEPDDLKVYDTPSRTGHTLLGGILGTLGGAGVGAGLGAGAGALFGDDTVSPSAETQGALGGAILGALGGGALGVGTGTHLHNKKIEDIIKREKLRDVLK